MNIIFSQDPLHAHMQNKSTVPFANQNNARNQVKKTLNNYLGGGQ
jgi:hypothetical protein